jgi:hypothetical protein
MSKTQHNLIKSKLEEHIWFRERSKKNEGIARLLIRRYNLENNPQINPLVLADLIAEASSLDRAWRKVLQENPHLRGSDYGESERLEQEKILELGYEVGSSIDKQIKLKI